MNTSEKKYQQREYISLKLTPNKDIYRNNIGYMLVRL